MAGAIRLLRRLAPGLALAGLVALVFRDALFRGQVLCERDIGLWVYGRVEAFVHTLAVGSWPVWDAYTAFGQPLLANPGAQVFYPWTWVNMLASAGTFNTIYAATHLLLSGVGFHILARRLGISTPGALTAAALWVTSGPMLSLVNVWLHFGGAAWIPWVLLATDAAFRSPGTGRSLLLGMVLAGQILSGSVDICAVTGLLAAAYALRFFEFRSPGSVANRRRIAGGCLAVGVALAVSAAQWLPALELLRASGRLALTPESRGFWSLHPVSLAQVLLPVLPMDLPLLPWVKRLLFDGRDPLVHSVYLGLAAVPLVAASLTGRSRRLVAALAALFLVSVLIALGRHAGVHEAVASILPPLRVLRYPSKITVLLPFAWALLAGLGFDAWRRGEASTDRRSRVIVALPAATATGLALLAVWLVRSQAVGLGERFLVPSPWGDSWPQVMTPAAARVSAAALLATVATVVVLFQARLPGGAALSSAALAALAVLDLFLAHQDLNPTVTRERFERPPVALEHIDRRGPTRVHSFEYMARLRNRQYRQPSVQNWFETAPARGSDPRVDLALGLQEYLYYASAARWGLASSFSADLQGVSPRHLTNLTYLFWASQETPDFLRLLRLGGVSYVLALHTEGMEGLLPTAVVAGPFTRPIHLYRVPDPLPRTYAVGRARVADGRAAYATLVDPAFDPAYEIVLPTGPVVRARSPFSGATRLSEYRPDCVRIEAVLDQPGYVVLVDAWDPGWGATVDGQHAPVLRANVAFRAVPVPAGAHVVEFRYRPRSVLAGLAISAMALLLLAVWWGLHRARAARVPVTGPAQREDPPGEPPAPR